MAKLLAVFGPLFLFAADVLAQAAPAAPQEPGLGDVLARMLPMFVVVMLIFYFMIMKPQQAKLNAQSAMLAGLKPGDTVVTSGGVIGRVSKSEKDFVLLEVASNVKIKVEPAHIAKKLEKTA